MEEPYNRNYNITEGESESGWVRARLLTNIEGIQHSCRGESVPAATDNVFVTTATEQLFLRQPFADCETANVKADKETLSPEDFAKVMDLLKIRLMQFCIFLKALVGVEEMQRMMVQAIGVAKKVP